MKKHSSDRPKYKRGNVADIALASVPNTSEEKLVQGAIASGGRVRHRNDENTLLL